MPASNVQVVVGERVNVPVVEASGMSPLPTPLPPRPSLVRRDTMMNALKERGWPPGLTRAMASSIESFPVRYVIVDNSGSMQSTDGERLVKTSNGTMRCISSTRWAELGDVVMDLAAVVSSLGAETHYHLLNPTSVGQYFVVADAGEGSSSTGRAGAPVDLPTLKRAMETSPTGTTPLTEAVQLVTRLIAPAAADLRARGQQAVVVLATDGLPNDPSSFLRALQELQRLPVWLVVRLCTNEDDVVDYWGELDKQLEAPLETLDDIKGEAKEVNSQNAWIVYGPALHLARTAGLQDKLFDLIDEVPLLPTQVKQLIERVLGCGELAEPEVDPAEFLQQVRDALATLPPVYNPRTGKMSPWIDMPLLQKHIRKHGQAGSQRGSSNCTVC